MERPFSPTSYPVSVKGVIVERNVFIVTYGCYLSDGQDDVEPVLSQEHKQVGLFTEDQVADLVRPQGYKTSVASWFVLLHADQQPTPGTAV